MDPAAPWWPQDDPLFDLDLGCAVTSHPRGPCPVEGLEDIVEELRFLASLARARRDARPGAGAYGWRTIAEEGGVRVVVPV